MHFSKLLQICALAVAVGAISAHAAKAVAATCANPQGDCCADADNGLCGAASCPGNGLGASNSNRVAKTLCTRFQADCVSSTTGNTGKCLGQTADTRLCIWKTNDANEDAFLCDKCTRTNAGYCNGRSTAEPIGTTTPPCACFCITNWEGTNCEIKTPCTNENHFCNLANGGGAVTPGRNKVDGCSCTCNTGYEGADCTTCSANYEKVNPNVNVCTPIPCTNANHFCNNGNGGGTVTPGQPKGAGYTSD